MNTYQMGEVVRVTVAFANQGGVAVDPDNVTARLINPHGRKFTVSLQKDSTGNYHGDFQIPLTNESRGTWSYRFDASGTYTGANEDKFTVSASAFAT